MGFVFSNIDAADVKVNRSNIVPKPAAGKKDQKKIADVREKQEKNSPLFTIPVFRANKYEFY